MLEIFKPKKNTFLPLKSRFLLLLTRLASKFFPKTSNKILLNLLCRAKGRRDYSLRTKIKPQKFTIKTQLGNMRLYHFQAETTDFHKAKNNFISSQKTEIKNKSYDEENLTYSEILLSHGWADSTIRFTQLIDHLIENGHCVWSLDHVGHGKSQGSFSHLFSFRDDVIKALNFIKNKTNKTPILVGHSMGALAILTLEKKILDATKVILISMPTKFYENMFQRTYNSGISPSMLESLLNSVSKKYKTDWELLSAHLQKDKFNKNFLVIHDVNDEVCSYENIKDLTKNTLAQFNTTINLGHLKILKNKEVLEIIEKFLY